MPDRINSAADFQSYLIGLIKDGTWGGVSNSTMSAILAAQAEVLKHK